MLRPLQYFSKFDAESSKQAELLEMFHASTNFNHYNTVEQSLRSFFHLNDATQIAKNSLNFKRYSTRQSIELPKPLIKGASLVRAFRERRSVRAFAATKFDLNDVASALYWPISREKRIAVGHAGVSRASYPSAGGLYPIETYFYALNVEALAPGPYHVDSVERSLVRLPNTSNTDRLSAALMYPPEELKRLMGVIIHTAVLERSTAKYGSRGYRFAILEAGHLNQNILLASTAAGLAALPWGGCIESEVSQIFNLNELEEPVVHCAFLGKKAKVAQ